MRLLFTHLLAAFVLVLPSAFGQAGTSVPPPDSTYALPEIRISSNRYSPRHRYVSARVSRLSLAKIQSTGGQSLDEVLQRAGSVFVKQYGTGLASLSMRGGNSSHSIIAIDGMPLYDPQLGQVDLSLVPSMLLENISIMHGQASSLYGANGLSGVIDLETRSHQNAPFFGTFKATMGAYGERQADGSIGFKKNAVSGLLAVRYGSEDGDFSYKDPSLFPVETVKRQGADRTFSSYFGKMDWLSGRSHTSLSAWVNQFERGLPGPINLAFRNERQWDRLVRVNIQHLRLVSHGSLSVRTGYQKMSLRYRNPFLRIDDTGRTHSISLDAYYKHQPNSENAWKVGLDNAIRTATHPSLADKANELQTSLYAFGEHKRGTLVLLPSIRLDRYGLPQDKTISAFSPSFGVNVNLPSIPLLFLKAQAGKSFRPPTFNDRFWQPGGNLDLKPEVSWGYEGSLLWDATGRDYGFVWATEITAYRQHKKDQITWLPTENGYWSPFNVPGVLVTGMESSLRVESSFRSQVRTNLELIYHHIDSRNQSDPLSASYNQPLRYTPRHLFKTIIGTSKSFETWSMGIDLFSQLTSKRYITEDGSSFLPPYWTADMRIYANVSTRTSRFSLHVLVENMFDRDYEIIKGYLMPPRLLRLELGIQWPGRHRSSHH